MATGQRAFREELATRLADAILHQPPVSPRALNARVSLELERIILKCLDKEPENRYQSAKELSVDLRRLVSPSAGLPVAAPHRFAQHYGRYAIMAVGLAVVLIVGMLVGLNMGGARDRLLGRTAPPRIASLAVLPLANLSGDPTQEDFSDGMTEALITNLARISALRVISRTSVMQYKGTKKPMPQIAKELNVDGVVEGSVQRSGDKVRITAQLIEGPTDRHLCVESYERDLRDILALQSDVAKAIAREIRVTLTPQERAHLATTHPVDREAYELYLRGRYLVYLRGTENFRKAKEYFQQAIDKDPSYAPAYAGLGFAYASEGFYVHPPNEVMPKAKVSVSKALELDESLAEAHTYLGHIRDFYDLDWAGAEREHKRAIELNPNDAIAHQFFAAYLIKMGRFNEAMAEQQRAHELDPLSFSIKAWGCWGYYQMRQYDRAVAECSETGNILEVWELKGMYEQFFQEAERDPRWLGDPKVITALKKALETSGIKGLWRKEIELGKEM